MNNYTIAQTLNVFKNTWKWGDIKDYECSGYNCRKMCDDSIIIVIQEGGHAFLYEEYQSGIEHFEDIQWWIFRCCSEKCVNSYLGCVECGGHYTQYLCYKDERYCEELSDPDLTHPKTRVSLVDRDLSKLRGCFGAHLKILQRHE